jgi:hypothetical protein
VRNCSAGADRARCRGGARWSRSRASRLSAAFRSLVRLHRARPHTLSRLRPTSVAPFTPDPIQSAVGVKAVERADGRAGAGKRG